MLFSCSELRNGVLALSLSHGSGTLLNIISDRKVYYLASPGGSVDSIPGCRLTDAVPEFSFDSGSAVRYQLRGGGSSCHTHIQLLLRTRASSGTLLSVMSREANEYIILEMVTFSVCSNLGDGADALQLPGQQVDIGQWVQVSLSHHDNLFTTTGGSQREIVVHPMVGNVSNSGEKTTLKVGFRSDTNFPVLLFSEIFTT
ncbi:LOW QUALITY PROTEIN: neural-cadherin-like [Xyrichtys novacula]|uniref:LOW QUALITY PROTEIN: neural-cadherin-like n=1 Tax=Xyrichtys novacula TaxID=13765 RepID=A0AAV1FC37_XYRNO|nr:LOW QUALITY PROTEIN: neural-cadherin-like [Xyrichtys novacula]